MNWDSEKKKLPYRGQMTVERESMLSSDLPCDHCSGLSFLTFGFQTLFLPCPGTLKIICSYSTNWTLLYI